MPICRYTRLVDDEVHGSRELTFLESNGSTLTELRQDVTFILAP